MKFQRKDFPLLEPGMLVEVIEEAQGYYTKVLVGKVGLVIKKGIYKSSNIWEVLIEEKTFNVHALDLKVLE